MPLSAEQLSGFARQGASFVRRTSRNYLTVFVGDFGRLFLQTGYFLILVNIFSLADMGIFSTVIATGLILGSIAGLGFGHLSYHAAAQRPRVLGAYLASTYLGLLVSLPIGLLISVPIYYLVFAGKLSLLSFVEILLVELLVWRVIEIMLMVNHGLGKYWQSTLANILSMGMRTTAALLFLLWGDSTLETWAHIYLVTNTVSALLVIWMIHPRQKLRLHVPLMMGRMKDAVYIGFSNFLSIIQTEIDKIIVIVLVGDVAAGIYTVSMRILFLISVPITSFMKLYSRKIINENSRESLLKRNLPIEGAVFVAAMIGFPMLMFILSTWPQLFGSNIATAKVLYGGLLFIPAFTNLIAFHNELYFAYGHQLERAAAMMLISIFKSVALIMVITMISGIEELGLWLNLIFIVMYLISVVSVYSVLTGRLKLSGVKAQAVEA